MRLSKTTPLIGYLAGLAGVGIVTVVIHLFLVRHIAVGNISMLYLIAVLATAAAFGSGPAILTSTAAFFTFNWLYIEPAGAFNIGTPEQQFALLLFLVTAAVTGRLAEEQRHRTRLAAQREREAVVLYDVVRLMSQEDLLGALGAVAERLRRELGLEAVSIELAEAGQTWAKAETGDASLFGNIAGQAAGHPDEAAPPADTSIDALSRWIPIALPGAGTTRTGNQRYQLLAVPVEARDGRIGTILLARSSPERHFGGSDERLLSAAATQVGLAAERARLRRETMETEILRRTDELKTALLNAVSHELRTPLASIIASAGSLLEQDVGWSQQERREFAEAIEQEALRLNRLVSNLLDLSRIQGGNLHPQKGWYDLEALIDDVVGQMREVVAGHGVAVDVQEDLPPVPLDYVHVAHVISNLVENAAKYSPAGSAIDISARLAGGDVRVEVSDRGPGIPQAAMRRLFEPFYRISESASTAKGTGLGLAIAKGLVEAHGGTIWAENREGGGAQFSFSLPAMEADSTAMEGIGK